MVARSPAEFLRAIRSHPLDELTLDGAELARARQAVEESGMLLVGEAHGVRETPSVLYTLARALDTSVLAFEWSHEETDSVVQAFAAGAPLDVDRLWSLPESAEFFSGDGRITAGHFALLDRLREERRLDRVVLFDRLDPVPPPEDWRPREQDMAERLAQQRRQGDRLLAVAGAFHVRLDCAEEETMAMHLARHLRVRPAVIDYARGSCWWCGEAHPIEPNVVPAGAIAFRVPVATPAVVPGR